ncbi:MAG: insulinase family protein, partial [Patescibacteria group bacterium]
MVLNKRFKNGIKLLAIPTKGTEAVSVLVLVRVGSRYEKKSLNGASHFIEHMFFKGTEKRPDNLSIARVLDGVGAEYNAFTAKDHTGYWIKVDKNKLEIALDVLSDII